MSKVILEQNGEMYDSETGELINEVEQVEVEVVENTLPSIVCSGGTHIKTNTEQLKKELVKYLSKYDIEVTGETEKEASKMATELNKLAKDLNSKRLTVGKEIKKPADELKNSVDELIQLVQDKRTSIIEGVEVFKSKRFEIIRGLLEQERDKLFEELKVSENYQFLDIEPLVKETSLGKTNLTKGAKESLLSMVRNIKALEDAVTIRTLQLKVTCLDAGLQFPIELNEVESFIKEDDYDQRLSLMIESRLKVETQVKENTERQEAQKRQDIIDQAAKREQDIRDEADRREKETADRIAKKEQDLKDEVKRQELEEANKIAMAAHEAQRKKDEIIAQEKATGKKIVEIIAVFKVEVNADIDDTKVLLKFKDKLSEFSTLESVSVK